MEEEETSTGNETSSQKQEDSTAGIMLKTERKETK